MFRFSVGKISGPIEEIGRRNDPNPLAETTDTGFSVVRSFTGQLEEQLLTYILAKILQLLYL